MAVTQVTVAPARLRTARRIAIAVIIVLAIIGNTYIGLCIYSATHLVYVPQQALQGSPADLGLPYYAVSFPARTDHVAIKAWLIPAVGARTGLALERTIIVVHGTRTNRTDHSIDLLDWEGDLAHAGFGVLALDMRGMGESPPAPLSLGYFEQRDVLGAVDYLQKGIFPVSTLTPPTHIGAWGVSMGGATVLLAAAHDAAIGAVVADCAYADIIPILDREVPAGGHLPTVFTPGIFTAARALYGIDYYAVRPVDYIAQIAPRPIYLIHGANDHFISPTNLQTLATAARSRPSAQVQTWLVPGADHAQSYKTHREEYRQRVVAFFTNALGPMSK